MKKIIYTSADGSLAVCTPVEGARLATAVTLADGTVLRSADPVSVDRFLRRWPVAGAVAEWAESEDEFVERIKAKDVPPDATNVIVADASVLPVSREKRRAWRIDAGQVVVDDQVEAAYYEQDAIKAIDGIDLLQFAHLFNIENRVRALESKAAVTKVQYRDALIALWKSLNQ